MNVGAAGQTSTTAAAFQTLYTFGVSPDGAFPLASLIHVDGVLYGTTSQGGSANASGDGTVFRITQSGREQVLYSFQGVPDGQFPQAAHINVNGVLFKGGRSDGADPEAGLLFVNGTFYGTTFAGGANTLGTIFQITSSGTESLIHTFAGPSDGANPSASLVDARGTLYGTTKTGGGANNGTVFSITP